MESGLNGRFFLFLQQASIFSHFPRPSLIGFMCMIRGNERQQTAVPGAARVEGNPIIQHVYTADPSAVVYDGRVYLFTGHDEAAANQHAYVMREWLCFSSPDMRSWQTHGSPLRALDFSWAQGDAFGSQVIAHKGKFYWYTAVTHATIAGKAIGVAVADVPWGPYRDARGFALVTNDMIGALPGSMNNLDPSVMLDDRGQAYLFWGNGQAYYARLNDSMTELDGPIRKLDLPHFQEGSRLYKRHGWYYLSYGSGMPEKIVYTRSRSLEGPWEYCGILNEIAGNCQTNSGFILDYQERSYFIYHNGALPGGGSHHRSVCIEYIYFNPDDTIRRVRMTSEGVTQE